MEDIKCQSNVVKLCYHPRESMLAGGTIDGPIFLWTFDDSAQPLTSKELNYNKKSCRSVRFSLSGDNLYSIDRNKSLKVYNLETERVILLAKTADERNCSPYCLEVIDENTLATGDDNGTVKVWDLRSKKSTMEEKQMDEFVSSLNMAKDRKTLIVTSGEGTVTAFNIRARRMQLQSELCGTEFTCSTFVKGGQKFVVGCHKGILHIFNNGEWGNISDRFPCHKPSIDCLVKVNENIVCTGSLDGKIRAVSILPNKIIGIVGEHEDGSSIIDLALSSDGKTLASCCDNELVKFWDVGFLNKMKIKHPKKKNKTRGQQHLPSSRKNNFFSDLQMDGD
ncbi:WD domain repeat-containing protein 55 [Chamberlinius hualienensis]